MLGFAAFFGFLAAVLIIAGWLLGNRVSDLQEAQLAQFRTDAETKIAASNQVAAQANALAQAAHADAETAKVEQLKLKNDSLKLEARLQEAEQKNATAQSRIHDLEQDKLPRTISDAQQAKIVELLRPFSGQDITAGQFSNDYEAVQYLARVTETLSKAGLKVNSISFLSGSGKGLGIAVHDQQFSSVLAVTIQHAFQSVGIEMQGIVAPNFVKTGEFMVFVGSKPSNVAPNPPPKP